MATGPDYAGALRCALLALEEELIDRHSRSGCTGGMSIHTHARTHAAMLASFTPSSLSPRPNIRSPGSSDG
jgi:hypothetical protein